MTVQMQVQFYAWDPKRNLYFVQALRFDDWQDLDGYIAC